MISSITLRCGHLNNKASKANNHLVNTCRERHIPVIGHSETVHPDTH